jgi:virulence-associated protein VagC
MRTTLFKNGGSQAVRIPAKYRFEGDTVEVEWDERLGALVVREDRRHMMTEFFAWLEDRPPFELPDVLPLLPNGRLDVGAFMDLGEELEESGPVGKK